MGIFCKCSNVNTENHYLKRQIEKLKEESDRWSKNKEESDRWSKNQEESDRWSKNQELLCTQVVKDLKGFKELAEQEKIISSKLKERIEIQEGIIRELRERLVWNQ